MDASPRVRAIVTLLLPAEGGRKSPVHDDGLTSTLLEGPKIVAFGALTART
jgi:hypothetical protein